MITRFAVLPDERRLILGVDKSNIFEAGMVYEITTMLDEIIIKKLGPYSLPPKGPGVSELSDVSSQLHSALHLITLEEQKSI